MSYISLFWNLSLANPDVLIHIYPQYQQIKQLKNDDSRDQRDLLGTEKPRQKCAGHRTNV